MRSIKDNNYASGDISPKYLRSGGDDIKIHVGKDCKYVMSLLSGALNMTWKEIVLYEVIRLYEELPWEEGERAVYDPYVHRMREELFGDKLTIIHSKMNGVVHNEGRTEGLSNSKCEMVDADLLLSKWCDRETRLKRIQGKWNQGNRSGADKKTLVGPTSSRFMDELEMYYLERCLARNKWLLKEEQTFLGKKVDQENKEWERVWKKEAYKNIKDFNEHYNVRKELCDELTRLPISNSRRGKKKA